MSFFTEGDSDPSVEQKRNYAVPNLGAEYDFTALDRNFHWLGGSATLQKVSDKSFG